MQIQLATFSRPTVNGLLARLSEVEKIELRRASPDRIHYLANTLYKTETGGNVEMLEEIQRRCCKTLEDYDNMSEVQFIPGLWKF